MELSITGLRVGCSFKTRVKIQQMIQDHLDNLGVTVSELDLFTTLAEASRLALKGMDEPEVVKNVLPGLLQGTNFVNSPF